jgi:hypothetical protein
MGTNHREPETSSASVSLKSTAFLWEVQTAMEATVARFEGRLRLFSADTLNKSEVTMRWWARQSEALHAGLELRLIRWRAVKVVRGMKRNHVLTLVEAADLERGLALLLNRSLAEIERRLVPGQRSAEGIQDHQRRTTWLPYS